MSGVNGPHPKREGTTPIKGENNRSTSSKGPSVRRLVGYLLLLTLVFFLLEQLIEALFGEQFDSDRLVDWLEDQMGWAWLFILGLWLLQAVVAPLPAPFLTMATALLYGSTVGGVLFAILLTWTGAMLGAVACFGLARWLGREWVLRKGHLDRLEHFDSYLELQGARVIFLARLIPILSFDVVSYAAGLTRIKWRDFLMATGLGMLPATVLLILFAYFALHQDRLYLYYVSALGMVLLAIASYLLTWLMNDYREFSQGLNEKGEAKTTRTDVKEASEDQ